MIYPGNKRYLTMADFPSYHGKSITFSVTGECNLRCTYCYIHTKDTSREMTFERAKEIIDTMFDAPHLYFDDPMDEYNKKMPKSDKNRKIKDSLIFEYIGGEPFIRTGLIDKISDYIKYKNYKDGLKYGFMFSFATNGVTYLNKEVQDYVAKNRENTSIGITIDGTKTMHDSCRIFPGGEGSYDIVRESIDAWKREFVGQGTKVTIAPENLPHLADALIHLWKDIGLQYIPANVVFEEVWKPEHAPIFEEQLLKIKDFLLTDENYTRYCTTLFDEMIGNPIDPSELTPPCGGNGAMLYWESDGSFYNCIRYSPSSCKEGEGLKLGDLDKGWDEKVYKQLCGMNRRTSSDDECFYCEVASGCQYCPGAQFDMYGDPDKRAKSICELHKVRVKVSRLFFEELEVKAGEMDYGTDIILIDEPDEAVEELMLLINKVSQLKSLLTIADQFPDLDIDEVMDDYYRVFGEKQNRLDSLLNKYLNNKGLDRSGYYFDLARRKIIKTDLLYAIPSDEEMQAEPKKKLCKCKA